jgi:hypothetical protein
MKVEGVDRLVEALKRVARKYLPSAGTVRGRSVIVGYTASYAVHVHENLEAAHGQEYNVKHAQHYGPRSKKAGELVVQRGPNQQAKFLEKPARELTNDGTLKGVFNDAIQGGADFQQALYLTGLAIQRSSQEIVPYVTGNLHGSAFTRKE